MGGPTAQNFIWGSLRFWWAVNFFCPTAHKIWRFGAVLENFEFFKSENVKILTKIYIFCEKNVVEFFQKINFL